MKKKRATVLKYIHPKSGSPVVNILCLSRDSKRIDCLVESFLDERFLAEEVEPFLPDSSCEEEAAFKLIEENLKLYCECEYALFDVWRGKFFLKRG